MDRISVLELIHSHERNRLRQSTTKSEKELRSVWVSQLEKEIQFEKDFIGYKEPEFNTDLSDEELLNELFK